MGKTNMSYEIPMDQLLYPIGVQSFSEIRERGYVYVDKTEYIHQLISSGKYYFLSRPRRFGKSLLLSTIEEFFNGRKDLFHGLAIEKYDYDWQAVPVLHLDLTGSNYSSPTGVTSHLDDFLSGWENKYGITPLDRLAYGLRFKNVIAEAHRQSGHKVVILVDEYDKPLLETIDRPELQEIYKGDLRAFYSNLKSQDSHIQFAMLTGVTRFGHLSIFSDLNNLNDISMLEEYSGICGITQDELFQYFRNSVEVLAENNNLSTDEAFGKLRLNYDGYHFSPKGSPDIYNPFSLLNALQKKGFGDYWFRTGTPTFLIKMIKSRQLSLQKLGEVEISQSAVENVSFDTHYSLIPVLYQAGYLTIKGYRHEFNMLKLGFPNREVEQGFFLQLMNVYSPKPNEDSAFSILRFYDDVNSGRIEEFMIRLQSFFADFDYDGFNRLELEQHYQDILFIIAKLLGFLTHIEYKTSSGRIDMVIKTPDIIYVFEFKMNQSAEKAMSQIDSKSYLLPFKADGRKLVKIGASFSDKTRSLDNWIIDEE